MRTLALLRGVNVGGARKLPMAALERAFRTLGAHAVETVIQSGNVVFEADDPEAAAIAAAGAIESEVGFRPAMILRSATAWRRMVEANPFLVDGQAVDVLHVASLAAAPGPERSAALAPDAFAPDAFVVAGADVYLRLPNGVSGARLTNARLDRAFAAVSTLRNWRTAVKLLQRLEA
ncbi:uncharacterized protein (DUF1697 family) [Roseiarcus fermentans]|uniref:Uncharacterized protein (DUF1697 family) n=1 Tax=Roseiarcus fermentans TaxID=1473586 RepID=A0A366EL53_9HYPH|nr:DUF1697 domain-containing protein [Roseiarcus fermentans]RBP03121.1 uncharacterized protein (DUF1697 family) [Roseiarcus fermentans]